MQEASGCLSSMFNTMGVSRQNGIFGPSVMFATPMDESQWLILTKSRNTLGSGPLHEVHLKQLLGAMRLNPKSFTDFVVLSREQKFPNIPDQENFDGSCTPEGEIRASSKCVLMISESEEEPTKCARFTIGLWIRTTIPIHADWDSCHAKLSAPLICYTHCRSVAVWQGICKFFAQRESSQQFEHFLTNADVIYWVSTLFRDMAWRTHCRPPSEALARRSLLGNCLCFINVLFCAFGCVFLGKCWSLTTLLQTHHSSLVAKKKRPAACLAQLVCRSRLLDRCSALVCGICTNMHFYMFILWWTQ